MLRSLANTLMVLGIVIGTFLALAVVTGSFFYYTVCPAGTERVGVPIAEYRLGAVPFFWQQPEGCIANNSVRVVLGELGVMEDITPRVPRLPDN